MYRLLSTQLLGVTEARVVCMSEAELLQIHFRFKIIRSTTSTTTTSICNGCGFFVVASVKKCHACMIDAADDDVVHDDDARAACTCMCHFCNYFLK